MHIYRIFHRRGFLYLLMVCLVLFGKLTYASSGDIKKYFINDPIFGGKSYIVEAGRNNKELVVLVHGLGDRASDTWTKFIPGLAKKYHVLTFDL
ncbi:MAG: hypothetical protein PVG20_03165, partial [Thioalkalispiraceae bacterium]